MAASTIAVAGTVLAAKSNSGQGGPPPGVSVRAAAGGSSASIGPAGVVEELEYRTLFDADQITKRALVYVPGGYDAQDQATRYPVLYLLHGSGGDETDFLGGPKGSAGLPALLDRLIRQQRIRPMIVVTPTYYPHGPTGADYHQDRPLNRAFPTELIDALIPAVEGRFHTYAQTVDAAGFSASRAQRAFGGFSMGAVTTWYVFTEQLASFQYFMPMAGDSWVVQDTGGASAPVATAAALDDAVQQSGLQKNDFMIAASIGSADGTRSQMNPQIEQMRRLPRSFDDDNLRYLIDPDGGHDMDSALHQIERALPLFF